MMEFARMVNASLGQHLEKTQHVHRPQTAGKMQSAMEISIVYVKTMMKCGQTVATPYARKKGYTYVIIYIDSKVDIDVDFNDGNGRVLKYCI